MSDNSQQQNGGSFWDTVKTWVNPVTNPVLNPVAALGSTAAKPVSAVTEAVHGVTSPSKGSGNLPAGFGTWLVGMVALGGVLLLMSDSEKYSQMAVALTAVIAVTVAFKWGTLAIVGVDETFGTSFGSHKA